MQKYLKTLWVLGSYKDYFPKSDNNATMEYLGFLFYKGSSLPSLKVPTQYVLLKKCSVGVL